MSSREFTNIRFQLVCIDTLHYKRIRMHCVNYSCVPYAWLFGVPRQTCSTTVPHQLVIEMRRCAQSESKTATKRGQRVENTRDHRRTGNANKMNKKGVAKKKKEKTRKEETERQLAGQTGYRCSRGL